MLTVIFMLHSPSGFSLDSAPGGIALRRMGLRAQVGALHYTGRICERNDSTFNPRPVQYQQKGEHHVR
jgi:hypothetical protein